MEKVSTGVYALDGILDGGIPGEATVLVVGRPGSGKTILAHQMMFHNATLENKVIYLTTLAEPQVKVMKFQQEIVDLYLREKAGPAVVVELKNGKVSDQLGVCAPADAEQAASLLPLMV